MTKAQYTYFSSALGGTFDHLHAGHESFLRFALERSQKVVLGLVDGMLLEKKIYRSALQSYEDRKRALETFFHREGRKNDVTIIPLFDMCGVATQLPTLEALFVTPRTLAGAKVVDDGRKQKHLSPLVTECFNMIPDQHGGFLSSTRIRLGQISRDGFVYHSLFAQDQRLSPNMRKELQKTWGSVLKNRPVTFQDAPVVLIGDMTTTTFLHNRWPFSFAYVDGVSRQDKKMAYPPGVLTETNLENPAGSFSRSVVNHITEQGIKNNQGKVFLIHGEEDVLVTPAVLCLPLGTHVIYGDPRSHCMRDIVVTEQIKETLRKLMTAELEKKGLHESIHDV